MLSRIVGRTNEKQMLGEALRSHRSELIAVYGRRRIGKTYLIREYFGNKITFSFTGLSSGKRKKQLKNFMLKLNEVTDEFKEKKLPVDWLEAFSCLKTFLNKKRRSSTKKVIFIDEFPWAATHKSDFLPAFENFWNDYCTTRTDLVVVVCGSAAAYMVKKIINNRQGLHNRLTQKIKLKPFTLHETQAFFEFKNNPIESYDLLKIYMTLGGVAEYLEHVNDGESSVQVIDRLCFQRGAYLENEYTEVFKSLYGENSYHERIMHALADNKKEGMSREDLLSASGISSGGTFSSSLEDLIESGFILEYEAYKDATKTTLYRIYDEFCLFYLKFMKPYKGRKWTQIYQKQEYKSWCGFAFETICLKHFREIKKGLNCDQIESRNYSWHNSKAQVDLVIDRNDDIVNLCEMKYYNDEFSIDAAYLKKLRNKEEEYRVATKSRKGIKTAMITTWGVKSNQYSKAIVRNSITMEALFLNA